MILFKCNTSVNQLCRSVSINIAGGQAKRLLDTFDFFGCLVGRQVASVNREPDKAAWVLDIRHRHLALHLLGDGWQINFVQAFLLLTSSFVAEDHPIGSAAVQQANRHR